MTRYRSVCIRGVEMKRFGIKIVKQLRTDLDGGQQIGVHLTENGKTYAIYPYSELLEAIENIAKYNMAELSK